MSAPDLSIVLVSWNTRDLLLDCLASVRASLAASPEIAAEVFVVDNGSRDGSPEAVRDAVPEARLIANERNVGFARANNQALREARGRYFLLLNPDTLTPGRALADLVAAMDARPDAAACGPLLLNGDGSVQLSWARFPDVRSEWSGALDRSQSPYPLADFDDPARRAGLAPFPVDWVGGACFLVRASVVAQVGLLDEGFFMYSEETEWCHRLRRGGCVLLVPPVQVVHLGGGSSRAVPTATRRRMWRSSLRFFRLRYGLLGGLLPAAVATGRYLLSPLRRQRA